MKNKIIIISAPSGTGKDTLAQMLLKKYPDKIAESVSVTDRLIRPGEKNGLNYHFVTSGEFQVMIENGEFLEYEEYKGNNYGTSKKVFEKILQTKNVLLVIDVKGAKKIMQMFEDQVISIFITPPSLEVLKDRLIKRGKISIEEIQARFDIAKQEFGYQKYFNKIIVNDKLNMAFCELVDYLKQKKVI